MGDNIQRKIKQQLVKIGLEAPELNKTRWVTVQGSNNFNTNAIFPLVQARLVATP